MGFLHLAFPWTVVILELVPTTEQSRRRAYMLCLYPLLIALSLVSRVIFLSWLILCMLMSVILTEPTGSVDENGSVFSFLVAYSVIALCLYNLVWICTALFINLASKLQAIGNKIVRNETQDNQVQPLIRPPPSCDEETVSGLHSSQL